MNQMTTETNGYQPIWKALLKSLGFILLFEASQFLLSFAVQLAMAFRIGGAGLSAEEALKALEDAYYPHVYEVMFGAMAIFLFCTALFYLFRPRRVASATGLKKCRPLALVTGVLLGFGAFFFVSWLMELLNLVPLVHDSAEAYTEQMEQVDTAVANSGLSWTNVLYTVLGAPFVEEVLFRGLVLRQMRRACGDWVAIVFAAAGFAFVHGNLFQGVFTLLLGVLLGYLAVKTDSVWPAFFLHAAFNGSNYLVALWQYAGLEEDSPLATWLFWGVMVFFVAAGAVGGALLVKLSRSAPPLTKGFLKKRPASAIPSFNETFSQTEGQTMAAPEFLIVGLGNPGQKYEATRHNAGFIALDYFALRSSVKIDTLRFRGVTGEVTLGGRKALLLKPQTFMNLSGESVREAAAYYRIPPEKILVLVDDVNFDPGVIRVRRDGSAGGHNGLKSIIACLGSESFPRVRIGVGKLPPERDLVSWVLGALPDGDMDKLVGVLEEVDQTVKYFMADNLDGAMNAFNSSAAPKE